MNRSKYPRGLRRRSAATRLLRLWVRIPPGAWMSLMSDVCQVDGLITRPEESYRLWCAVFDQETSRMGRAWPALGRNAIGKKYICYDANYASYPDENLQAA